MIVSVHNEDEDKRSDGSPFTALHTLPRRPPVMKFLILGIFLPLAITATAFAEASTPSERKLIKAIREDSIKPVKAYIDSGGKLNTVIEIYGDLETGDTLLHHAASYGSTKVLELLLKSGADPLRMDASMEYPIEAAIRNDREDAIRLLSRPEDKRRPEEITTDLLYRLVAGCYRTSHEGDKKLPPVFVRLNGKDPSGAQMDRLRPLARRFAPFSKIPYDPDEQPEKARAENPRFTKLSISTEPSADGNGFDWIFSISDGPLSGRGAAGHFSQLRGYWILETTRQWVS